MLKINSFHKIIIRIYLGKVKKLKWKMSEFVNKLNELESEQKKIQESASNLAERVNKIELAKVR